MIVNKKKTICQVVDFVVSADHKVKLKESEKKHKYRDFAEELKKTMEQESDRDTNCNWCSWYSHQRIVTRTGRFGNKRTSGNYPNYSIVEIGPNTEKSPGDMRRLAVTQTSVRNQTLK